MPRAKGSAGSTPAKAIKLTEAQKKEGYWVEESGEYVLVWHHKNQVALLHSSPDIDRKVKDSIEKRRKELKEVEEKTGWKGEVKDCGCPACSGR